MSINMIYIVFEASIEKLGLFCNSDISFCNISI
jgi:hypothetical protein